LAALGGCFGLLGLVVACLGVFGVMAFQVARRTNELGVRMALGANRSDIIWLVLREVAIMLLVGSVIGCVAAMTLTRLAKNMLFGLTASDPVLYLMATAILGGATLAAGYFPALRASRVHPMVALRHE
jgi:ABC-type antimicrobial peptide transport system permease subunit